MNNQRTSRSSWNNIYEGVEIDCEDAHIIVSSLPTRAAKLDEILKIEASGSGWRLPTEKEAQVMRRYLLRINKLMKDNGGNKLSPRATLWLHGKYGIPDKVRVARHAGICAGPYLLSAFRYLLLELVVDRAGFPSGKVCSLMIDGPSQRV